MHFCILKFYRMSSAWNLHHSKFPLVHRYCLTWIEDTNAEKALLTFINNNNNNKSNFISRYYSFTVEIWFSYCIDVCIDGVLRRETERMQVRFRTFNSPFFLCSLIAHTVCMPYTENIQPCFCFVPWNGIYNERNSWWLVYN